MNNFFILGLPRSRTAWLSAFMNYGGAFCYHEGINGCSSVEEYRTKLGSDRGDSLTGATLIGIQELFPYAPKVIIDSDPKKAIDFAVEVYNFYNPEFFHNMKRQLDSIPGLHIDVNDIDDRLPEIWQHLQRTKYDEERGELIKKLNVQVIDPHDVDYEAMRKLLNVG